MGRTAKSNRDSDFFSLICINKILIKVFLGCGIVWGGREVEKRRIIVPEKLSCRTSHDLGNQDPQVGKTLRD